MPHCQNATLLEISCHSSNGLLFASAKYPVITFRERELRSTVSSEIFVRILLSRMALKHIFSTLIIATRA